MHTDKNKKKFQIRFSHFAFIHAHPCDPWLKFFIRSLSSEVPMRSLMIFLVGFVSCLFAMAVPALADGKKYALLVGVKRYDGNPFNKLPSAEQDALALEAALREVGFSQVVTMTAEADLAVRRPVSAKNILSQLDGLLKGKEKSDTVLVFLSGHGIQLKGDPIDQSGNKETYFCPEEAKVRDRATLIPISIVMGKLAACPADRKLLLIDSCREEMLADDAPEKAGGTIELEPVGVKRAPPPAGLAALFSCGPGETSRAFKNLGQGPSKEIGHGAFTHFALKYLKGEADTRRYQNDQLLITELAAYVSRETQDYVFEKLGTQQTPELLVPGGLRPWSLGELRKNKPALLVAPFTRDLARTAQDAWAKSLRIEREGKNSIGQTLVVIPPGEFDMGNEDTVDELLKLFPYAKKEWFDDAVNRHRVRITQPYLMSKHECTIGQFRRFVSDTGYKTDAEKDGKGGYGWADGTFNQDPKFTWKQAGFDPVPTDDHPVVNVSWNDAVAFCNWLSQKENKSPYYRIDGDNVTILGGSGYRLPTEAEWEYAGRAGTSTRVHSGNDPDSLATVGNVADGTAKEKFSNWNAISAKDGYVFTAPVGKFADNNFGLKDMHGNVWEWCWDVYGEKYYETSQRDDPAGPLQGSIRVIRGGGWSNNASICRSANRSRNSPGYRNDLLGFRVAVVPSSP